MGLQSGLRDDIMRSNIVELGRCSEHRQATTNLLRRLAIDTLSPHADNSNPIPTTSGIYKITCTANKRFYIGSSSNLSARKGHHWSALKRNQHHNPHIQRAWNKYGEQSFTFEVLELVLPMSLEAREQYWLNKLKPFGRKGFNIALDTVAFHLGRKASPEAIEKNRQARLGKKLSPEHRESIRQAHLGKQHSPEHVENHRQATLGKKRTPEMIEAMRQRQLGKPSWNKGEKLTLEHREKLRQAHLGYKHTPEACENMRQAKLGKKLSPETIAKRTQTRWGKREEKQS